MRVSRIVGSLPDTPYLLGESLSQTAGRDLDVSVVMPCLNEETGVATAVLEALGGIALAGLTGEVIVVDNGSSDGSTQQALLAGARVVVEPHRGYGRACSRGLTEARGRIVVLGDADGTYDFGSIPLLIAAMGEGVDLVMGNRLNSDMERGAMPWLHRRVGNPVLTGLLNILHGTSVSDAHCGLRAIRRSALAKLRLDAPGMEFASEFLIEAASRGLRMTEVPITYRRRLGGVPKLRTWRDGWRHLKLILLRRVRRSGGSRAPVTRSQIPATRLPAVGGPPGLP
jgi:glycosyltransferase involved in cell wall biosynthesis